MHVKKILLFHTRYHHSSIYSILIYIFSIKPSFSKLISNNLECSISLQMWNNIGSGLISKSTCIIKIDCNIRNTLLGMNWLRIYVNVYVLITLMLLATKCYWSSKNMLLVISWYAMCQFLKFDWLYSEDYTLFNIAEKY